MNLGKGNGILVLCVEKCIFALTLCVEKCNDSMISCVEKCNELAFYVSKSVKI